MQLYIKLPEDVTNVLLKIMENLCKGGDILMTACAVVALEINPLKFRTSIVVHLGMTFFHTTSVEMQSFRNCALLTFHINIA